MSCDPLAGRFRLNCTPYANNTLNDLNMRRKAETLKHPTEINNLTKGQKWSIMVSNKVKRSTPVSSTSANGVITCNNGKAACGPSTAADVPGPEGSPGHARTR